MYQLLFRSRWFALLWAGVTLASIGAFVSEGGGTDKLDDTAAQLANDHLVGASPRGWEDISNVLRSGVSESARRVFVQGRIGAANDGAGDQGRQVRRFGKTGAKVAKALCDRVDRVRFARQIEQSDRIAAREARRDVPLNAAGILHA